MDYFKIGIFLLLSGGLLIAQTTNTNDNIYFTLSGDTATIWDAQNVAGGIYFYRLTTLNSRITKKLVILK